MPFEYSLTAREQARLEAVTAKLISDAAAEGLTVTRAQLEDLPTVRMAVLTDLGLDDRAMEEVRRAVPDQVRAREVQRQLNDPESDLHRDLSRNPYQKLSLGHELEAQKKAIEAVKPRHQMTAEEEAKALIMLRSISHPATRLAAAREIGLA
jgi:hypothetical protein